MNIIKNLIKIQRENIIHILIIEALLFGAGFLFVSINLRQEMTIFAVGLILLIPLIMSHSYMAYLHERRNVISVSRPIILNVVLYFFIITITFLFDSCEGHPCLPFWVIVPPILIILFLFNAIFLKIHKDRLFKNGIIENID